MNKGMNESASYAVIKLLGEIADAVGESIFFKRSRKAGWTACQSGDNETRGLEGASCQCHVLGGASMPCFSIRPVFGSGPPGKSPPTFLPVGLRPQGSSAIPCGPQLPWMSALAAHCPHGCRSHCASPLPNALPPR